MKYKVGVLLRLYVYVSACWLVISLVGVSLASELPGDIKARVEARWAHLSDYDFGSVYEFTTPVYRAVFSKNLHVQKFSADIGWSLTEIENIKYDSAAKLATVTIVVETVRNSEGQTTQNDAVSVQITEKWLHIDNQWWHSSNE